MLRRSTGNLPYTATHDAVAKHFSKIAPSKIRLATEKKDAQKCRGFGFIDFMAYDRMKTCLKLYHHSIFDDGVSPGRRINVELTYVPRSPLSQLAPMLLYLRFG